MYLHKTPFWLKLLYPSFIWNKSREDKKIFLTFDDGPIPVVTAFVLEQLQHYKAKATFFCVGDNIEKYPHVFNKIVSQGHRVGNHTFNHLNGWKEKDDVYCNNIAYCQSTIDSLYTAKDRLLLRPPYGKIKRSQAKRLRDKYDVIMWDVLSGDYDDALNEERCLKKTIRATRNGSIVVFHDSIKAEKNLRYCLPRFLSHFAEKGYSFESL